MYSCAKCQTTQSAKVCESTKLCIILYRTDPGDQTDQTNHCNWLECSKFMVQTLLNMRDGWTQVQVCEWVRNDDQCKRCYHQLDHFTEITCFRPQIAWKLCLCSSHRVWHTRVAFAKSFPLSCTLSSLQKLSANAFPSAVLSQLNSVFFSNVWPLWLTSLILLTNSHLSLSSIPHHVIKLSAKAQMCILIDHLILADREIFYGPKPAKPRAQVHSGKRPGESLEHKRI